ncbi:MAG: ADOP family duplicated permease [Acidobacteria bacterium]|nr:ADOP family duplicated permease [Acidobacteriota bacterium]
MADHVRAGLSPRAARRRARLEFGALDHIKELCRDARGTRWIDETWQDLRFAARLLARERWVAAGAVLALGLGLGISSAAFTAYNGLLLRGLPVDDQQRVTALAMRDETGVEQGVSYLDFQDWRDTTRSFEDLAAYTEPSMNVSDPGMGTEQLFGARVTANVFGLLGVQPLLGRDFHPDDDRPGVPPVVLLGHDIWMTRYGASPQVLGRIIQVNDVPSTVIGVMPQGFEFSFWAELWQPLSLTPGLTEHARDRRVLRAVGRLANGVSLARAQAELDAVAAGLAETHPDTNAGLRPRVAPFHEAFHPQFQPALNAVMAAAVLVLLVACANAANLLLARAARRSREVGMRVSLGATRGRIVRQLLAESGVIAGLAGVLGLGLAALAARLLSLGIAPLGAPFWIDFPVDGRVAAFLILACLSTAPVFGLAPALHASRANVRDVSTGRVRGPTAGRPERRWMAWLVAAQVALTLVLLAGAGLMARSLLTLARADRILNPAGMTAIQLRLPESRYAMAEQRLAFFRTLDERIAATAPGLGAARASRPPFVPAPRRELAVDGRPVVGDGPSPTVGVVTVSNDYFERLDLGLQRGRAFTDRDGTVGNETTIVNGLLAETFFADQDPLGRRIRLTPDGPDDDAPWLTVIGVSPTVRQSFGAAPPIPVAYLPYRAEPLPFTQILARDERQTAAAVGAMRELDAEIPLRIYTMDVVLGNTMFLPRLIGSLLAAFAWIALVLSAVGLYGVTACAAMQRTQEIGVRMALGARAGQMGWMVLRRGLSPVGIGFAAGIWGALTVGRLFESWLVETPPTDPVTQCAVAVSKRASTGRNSRRTKWTAGVTAAQPGSIRLTWPARKRVGADRVAGKPPVGVRVVDHHLDEARHQPRHDQGTVLNLWSIDATPVGGTAVKQLVAQRVESIQQFAQVRERQVALVKRPRHLRLALLELLFPVLTVRLLVLGSPRRLEDVLVVHQALDRRLEMRPNGCLDGAPVSINDPLQVLVIQVPFPFLVVPRRILLSIGRVEGNPIEDEGGVAVLPLALGAPEPTEAATETQVEVRLGVRWIAAPVAGLSPLLP